MACERYRGLAGRISSNGSQRWPWIADVQANNNNTREQRLHNEIVAYVSYIQPTLQEREIRRQIYDFVTSMIKTWSDRSSVTLFGSVGYDLCLPNSDLDIVVGVSGLEQYGKKRALFQLGAVFEQSGVTKSVKINHWARVPYAKFVTVPRFGSLNIDITINNTYGPEVARRINTYRKNMPALRPLVLIIKKFLQQRNLNSAALSGLGSYAVICMTISFLQLNPARRPLEYINKPSETKSLGTLLLDFLHYYGRTFPYDRFYISVTRGKLLPIDSASWVNRGGKPQALVIQCLVYPEKDIAKAAAKIGEIRDAFQAAHNMLSRFSSTTSHTNSLGCIIHITQEAIDYRAHITRLVNSGKLVFPKQYQQPIFGNSYSQKSSWKMHQKVCKSRTVTFWDVLFRLLFVFFVVHALLVCPDDTKHGCPICNGLSKSREQVLGVFPAVNHVLTQSPLGPHILRARPYINTVIRIGKPIFQGSRREWNKSIGPHLTFLVRKTELCWNRVAALDYNHYSSLIVTHGRLAIYELPRCAQPYITLAATKAHGGYQFTKPYTISAWNHINAVVKQLLLFTRKLQVPFINSHVAWVGMKVQELVSGLKELLTDVKRLCMHWKEIAEKHANLRNRHANLEADLNGLIKVKLNSFAKTLVVMRKDAVADLWNESGLIKMAINELSVDAEKYLDSAAVYLEALKKVGEKQVIKVGPWGELIDKVNDMFKDRLKETENLMNGWYVHILGQEVQEVQMITAEICYLSEQAQTYLIPDFAILTNITAPVNWQRYYDLTRISKNFIQLAARIQNGTHHVSPINPILSILKAFESEVQEIAKGFEPRLQMLKNEAEYIFSKHAQ